MYIITVLVLLNVFSVWSSTRTVTFTGVQANYASKDNVTIVRSTTDGSTTISCVNSSSQNYIRFNGATNYIKFTLDNEDEKIDSIGYIWRAFIDSQHFLFLYGESLTLGNYLGSGDSWYVQNGGWSKSSELNLNETNCPGNILKFPEGTNVSSFVMCRRLVIND